MEAVLEQMKRLQTRLVEVFMAWRLPEDSLFFIINRQSSKRLWGRSRAEEKSVKSRKKGENYNSFSLDKNQFPFKSFSPHYALLLCGIKYLLCIHVCCRERERDGDGSKGDRDRLKSISACLATTACHIFCCLSSFSLKAHSKQAWGSLLCMFEDHNPSGTHVLLGPIIPTSQCNRGGRGA